MLSTLVSESATTSNFNLVSFLICLASALLIGAFIAVVHIKTTHSSGSFAVTLAILPSIVTVIIMMVSGSIGAGIAVAGAFSLVRFRSIPGTAREIGSIFLAMASGLACGMGYPLFAAIFAVILCLVMILYTALGFGNKGKGSSLRTLNITIPEDINYTDVFDDLFDKYTKEHSLITVKTTNLGSLNKLTYKVVLKNLSQEKEFIDELRCRNGNLEIGLSIKTEAAAEL